MAQMQVRQRYYIPDQSSSLYDDVVQTITHLERLKREEPAVARCYEEWRRHRKETIDTIDDLQKKIDIINVGSNVAKCVGAAAGIVGLISGIAGLFLEANEEESAEDFKKFGSYCSGAGVAVVASSTLIEAGLTQSVINDIKRVVEKDDELTNSLKNWIEFSRKVDHCMNRLFQCNIASTTFKNVMDVCRHCVRLLINGEAELQDLMRRLQTCKMIGFEDISMEVMQKVLHFLGGIQKNPKLIQPAEDLFRIFRETPHTFDFAKSGIEIYNSICGSLGAEPLTNLLSAVGLSSISLNIGLMGRCALDTIAIGSQVVTIILAVQNIRSGKSNYSELLDQLKSELRMELQEITSKMDHRVRKSYLNYEERLRICY